MIFVLVIITPKRNFDHDFNAISLILLSLIDIHIIIIMIIKTLWMFFTQNKYDAYEIFYYRIFTCRKHFK